MAFRKARTKSWPQAMPAAHGFKACISLNHWFSLGRKPSEQIRWKTGNHASSNFFLESAGLLQHGPPVSGSQQ
eukprot:5303633-Alexandrium_andersonii.AAC.2